MNRRMRLGVVCGVLLAVASPVAHAEEVTGWDAVLFGGMTQAKLTGSNQPFSGSDSRNAFAGGAGFMLRVNDELGFEFGLRYAQKGADGAVDLTDYSQDVNAGTERITGDGTTKLDFVELPVTVAGYLPTGQHAYLRGYVGMSLAVLTGASFEGTLQGKPADLDIKDNLEGVDLCWVVGASWTYELEKVSLWLDGRYVGGTRSIDKSNRDYDVKTSTREFALGVGIPLTH